MSKARKGTPVTVIIKFEQSTVSRISGLGAPKAHYLHERSFVSKKAAKEFIDYTIEWASNYVSHEIEERGPLTKTDFKPVTKVGKDKPRKNLTGHGVI